MNTAAWQAHANQRKAVEDPSPASAPIRMEWTQHPDFGPGAEILGAMAGREVVELGCGAGHNLAHLAASCGATSVGVDAASAQIERARARYGHVTGIAFLACDAQAFLASNSAAFDACYSVFGAIGLTPPRLLLPTVASALAPGGVLAFSVPHPNRRGRRRLTAARPAQHRLTLPDGAVMPILRWELAAPAWASLLQRCGFVIEQMRHMAHPDAALGLSSLIVTARQRRHIHTHSRRYR